MRLQMPRIPPNRLLFVLVWAAWAAAGPLAIGQDSAELRDVLVHDFRGRPLRRDMTLFGPQASGFVKVEAEGLRITLPRDRETIEPVGLSMPLKVQGDFEITAAIEIFHADEPAIGKLSYGVGVLMSINEAARVGRLVRFKNQVATWDRWAPKGGERVFLNGAARCKSNAGQLRLKRAKTTLLFLWAPEIAGDHFQEVYRCEFNADEVTLLRLELNSDLGGKSGDLDVRLLELRVRDSSPAPAQPVAPDEEPPASSKGWLVAAGIAALAIVIALFATLALRFSRRKARLPASDKKIK